MPDSVQSGGCSQFPSPTLLPPGGLDRPLVPSLDIGTSVRGFGEHQLSPRRRNNSGSWQPSFISAIVSPPSRARSAPEHGTPAHALFDANGPSQPAREVRTSGGTVR